MLMFPLLLSTSLTLLLSLLCNHFYVYGITNGQTTLLTPPPLSLSWLQLEEVMLEATEGGREARSDASDWLHVARGMRISAVLSLPVTFTIESQQKRQEVFWAGKQQCMVFPFTISSKAGAGTYPARINVTAGAHTAEVSFNIDVAPAGARDGLTPSEKENLKQYRKCQSKVRLQKGVRRLEGVKMEVKQQLKAGHYGYTELVHVKGEGLAVRKRLKVTNKSTAVLQDLEHEAAVLASVGKHPNVVELKGISLETEEPFLLFEYVTEGDLEGFRALAPSISSPAKPKLARQFSYTPSTSSSTTISGASSFPYSPITSSGDIYDEMPYYAQFASSEVALEESLSDGATFSSYCDIAKWKSYSITPDLPSPPSIFARSKSYVK